MMMTLKPVIHLQQEYATGAYLIHCHTKGTPVYFCCCCSTLMTNCCTHPALANSWVLFPCYYFNACFLLLTVSRRNIPQCSGTFVAYKLGVYIWNITPRIDIESSRNFFAKLGTQYWLGVTFSVSLCDQSPPTYTA